MTAYEILGIVVSSGFCLFAVLVAYSCAHLSGTISQEEEKKDEATRSDKADN